MIVKLSLYLYRLEYSFQLKVLKIHIMHKILIPTDFSPVADNALNYAIEIAAKFKSDLYLYHVYMMNKRSDYDWHFPSDEQPYVKKIEQSMDFTKQKFMEKIIENGLSIRTRVEEKHIYSLFEGIVMKHEINLIIMGSKGASGLTKAVFGSVAASALDLAEVPVLVVPPGNSFLAPKQIVLAVDLNQISQSVLSPLQELAAYSDCFDPPVLIKLTPLILEV